ncbi:Malectin-like domain [Arabidopsis thaliana x Arabidopsis arenosa]|uniref:Malectin-like domain n=1 Tax=Arabidopsis thaliana x Arabidopsis arenosa TaxID=1240361 RepID=A0A8T2EYR9_9BRAS|nr:Malectin-like domain [Arabidopsis thaliana x Arabidopsis arenosa]
MIHAGVNIDCGTSLPGVDNNNLKWVGDQDFITSGDSATISSTTVEKSLTTLRYFPTGDSNCYSNIPVTKGGKVLVRTMFYYGNYDGKSSTPSFSVVFEGKHRGTLSISSAFEPYLLELIFSPAGGETSVCFVRTSSSSNPFVSSIEVVDLDDGMYAELGPGEGRFWLPSEINILVTGIPSGAVSIDTSGASNKPPESVLRNSWTGEGLSLVDPTLPSAEVPVYLAMYFSEPLESSLRSFNIFFGGKQVGRGPVVPLFGKATQVVVRDVVASSSTLLTLWSTSSALLPPMINAAELYVISKGTSESTGGNGTGSGSGSGSGSGGSGGGGSGSSGSGSGSGGTSKGGTGGGSTNGKSSKLPIILGVVSAVAFVLVAYVFIAIILANRRKVRLQALAMPTSTVATMGTGPSTLFTQQMDNDSTSNQPTNEMGEIDDLTG